MRFGIVIPGTPAGLTEQEIAQSKAMLDAQRRAVVLAYVPLLNGTERTSDPRVGPALYKPIVAQIKAQQATLFGALSELEIATMIFEEGVRHGFPFMVPYTPDQWLSTWGGSPDLEAECVAAHVGWYYAKRGVLGQNAITIGGQSLDTRYLDAYFWLNKNRWRGDRLLQPLYGAEDGDRIKVKDLPWFLEFYIAWANAGLDTLHQNGVLLVGEDGAPAGGEGHIPSGEDRKDGPFLSSGVILYSPVHVLAISGKRMDDSAIVAAATSAGVGLLAAMVTANPVAIAGALIAWAAMVASLVVGFYESAEQARATARSQHELWDRAITCTRGGGTFNSKTGVCMAAGTSPDDIQDQIDQLEEEKEQGSALFWVLGIGALALLLGDDRKDGDK